MTVPAHSPTGAPEYRRYVAVGEKTLIRRMQRTDIETRHQWPPFTDPLYASLNPRPTTRQDREEIYQRRLSLPDWRWFTILDYGEAMVGELALREINNRKRSARLGIHLRADRIGMGYGTDAMNAFLVYFFEHLRFGTLHLDVAEHNRRAVHVYEKIGFRIVGRHTKPDRSGLPIFTDESYAEIRPYFENRRGKVRVRFLDMLLSAEEWRESRSGVTPSR